MKEIDLALQEIIRSDLSDYMSLNKFQEAKNLLDANRDYVDVMYGEGNYFYFSVRYQDLEMLETLLELFEETNITKYNSSIEARRYELKEALQDAISKFGSTPEIDELTREYLPSAEEEDEEEEVPIPEPKNTGENAIDQVAFYEADIKKGEPEVYPFTKTNLKINISDIPNENNYELKAGSITPTTLALGSRKFFDVEFDRTFSTTESSITASASSRSALSMSTTPTDTTALTASTGTGSSANPNDNLSGIVYVENYVYDKNAVLHFGINSNNISVLPDPHNCNNVLVLGETVKLVPHGLVIRGNYNTDQCNMLINEAIVHHGLEKTLLFNAINYLLEKDEIKTVLVDIFPRELGGVKLLDNNRKIEAHTVVLYKQPINAIGKHKIILIDPSDSTYSCNFSNKDISSTLAYIPKFDELITLFPGLQIYQSKGSRSEGPGRDQYRDCADIAVKLAFGFNKMQEDIDVRDIKENAVVKAISNNPMIDENSIIARGHAFRIKQSSDFEKVKLVNTLEKIIKDSVKIVEASSDRVMKVELGYRLNKWFSNDENFFYPPDLKLKNLIKLSEGAIELSKTVFDTQQKLLNVDEALLRDIKSKAEEVDNKQKMIRLDADEESDRDAADTAMLKLHLGYDERGNDVLGESSGEDYYALSALETVTSEITPQIQPVLLESTVEIAGATYAEDVTLHT